MRFGGKTTPAFSSAIPPSTTVAKRRWRGLVYLGAALCGFAGFLLITLPAYWADWLVSRASHNTVRIQQPEGTLWDGTGNLVIHSAGQERMQTRIAWELQPRWLFTGKLQVRLSSRDGGNTAPAYSALPPSMAVVSAPLNATLRIGYRHLSISDVDAAVPVSVLSAFNPVIDLVAPSGHLQITAQQATLTTAGLEGSVQLTWLGAGARLGGLSEVGDYRLVVNGRGATAELRIDTLRGDVGITAQGEWQAQGEGLLHLTGNINPGSREQTLRPLLAMMKARNNNGQYNWAVNSRFSPAQLIGVTQ
jgi:general secretion pathway protein N